MSTSGQAGERAAEYLFRRLRWQMFRTQPGTKVVRGKFGPVVIHCDRGGIADYTGYVLDNDGVPVYRACEVKEERGGRMIASRLSRKQRDWMAALPPWTAYVAVLWTSTGVCELFPFVYRGSYLRGAGVAR